MDEFLHFPESFPVRSLAVLAPIVRSGKVADKVEAGEAALTLQAWAMGQYLGHDHGPRVVGSAGPDVPSFSAAPVSKKAAAAALDELEDAAPVSSPDPDHNDSAAAVQGVVGKIDFRKFLDGAVKILQFVLPLILKS